MKVRQSHKVTDHSGSTFDSFLEREGIREEVEAVAIKRVLTWSLSRLRKNSKRPGEHRPRLPTVCLIAKKNLGPTWVQQLPN